MQGSSSLRPSERAPALSRDTAGIPRETCFVMLDDNGDELVIAQAYFRQAGLRNRVHLETDPDRMMRRLQVLRESGVEARDIVVLLDIRMPGSNGFEQIYAIRNTVETHAIRIVMLSASSSPADRQDAEAIGADGYIVKPFTIAKLAAALVV